MSPRDSFTFTPVLTTPRNRNSKRESYKSFLGANKINKSLEKVKSTKSLKKLSIKAKWK